MAVLGIDIGSVSIAAAAVTKSGKVLASSYVFHRGRIRETLRDVIQSLSLDRFAGVACTSSTPSAVTTDHRYDLHICFTEAARRIDVMINKYWTARACTEAVRDGIEVLGGNGTIEDFSVLPRLYRDAIVVESWEGTHNTLCAQVLRDVQTRALHEPWLERIAKEVSSLDRTRHHDMAQELFAGVKTRLAGILEADAESAWASIRQLVDTTQ